MKNNVELKTYSISEIAKIQLETAIFLFIRRYDLSSAITLSGASSNILHQLVINANKVPFLDYACIIHDGLNGSTPKRNSYKHHIHSVLGINDHKHMDYQTPLTCRIDLLISANSSIGSAVADYVTLYGQEEYFIKHFLNWNWQRTTGMDIIDSIKNMPDKLKKREKWRKDIDQESLKDKIASFSDESFPLTYHRFQLAENQLKTSIYLFLTNLDRISSITLAGAADAILCELVNRDGNDNFTDILSKKNGGKHGSEIGNEINKLLYINYLKHFDKGDPETLELDVDGCAVAAILKALANYNMQNGKNQELIRIFRTWVKVNFNLQVNDL